MGVSAGGLQVEATDEEEDQESGPSADQAILNQQNQQLKLVGGCNAINSRDLNLGSRLRPTLPIAWNAILKKEDSFHLLGNIDAVGTAPS
jgi:hypothetical protein